MPKRRQQSFLERADSLGRFLETALLVLLFGLLLILASSQILLRNVLSAGLVWADGLVRLAVLWLAVLGAVAAARDRKHIAIDLVTRSFSGILRVAVVAVVQLVTSGISAYFAWQSWRFVQDSRAFGDMLLGDWPAWWFQLILPVGFALVAYRYLVRALSTLAGSR